MASALAATGDQMPQNSTPAFFVGGLDSPIGAAPQTAGTAEGSNNHSQDGSAGRGRGRGGQKVSKASLVLVWAHIFMAIHVSQYNYMF